MDDITIDETVDDSAWEHALDAMMGRLMVATSDASLEAAEYIGGKAAGKIQQSRHDPLSFSPTAPGDAPATVSGNLAASITAVRSGTMSAMVGPTAKYGRIQELGGEMHGHPFMKFTKQFADGAIVDFKRSFIRLPARPYLEPATSEAVASGRVQDIYVRYWAIAMEG